MTIYADTSYLVSLYTFDAHTAAAIAHDQQALHSSVLTGFGRFELQNALRLKVFRREISSEQAAASLAALEEDITAGAVILVPCAWERVLSEGEQLSRRFTAQSEHWGWMFYMWQRQLSLVRRSS